MDLVVPNSIIQECQSTNEIIKEFGSKLAPHGTWIASRCQTGGRGRHGKKWESHEGNLFYSVLARLENRDLWSWVPLTVATGVHSALKKLYPSLNLKIRWPNDLWVDDKKMGGILCESVSSSTGAFIVIGLGLNCISSPSHLKPATDLKQELLEEINISIDALIPPIHFAILKHLKELEDHGKSNVIEHYERSSRYKPGDKISWGEPLRSGTVQGLGQSGELLILENGKSIGLFAEEISLSGN